MAKGKGRKKLLLDENLSRRLVPRIADLFPGSAHLSAMGLLQASDSEIWRFARENDFCIVSADADFYEMATSSGHPPKVVWLKGCDYPSSIAEELIRSQSIRIMEFLQDEERSVLVLEPSRKVSLRKS